KAQPRESWSGADAARPLTTRGARQAKALVGPLRAFGVRRIVSSDAVRCVTTVTPLAAELGRTITRTPLVGQDAWEEGTSDLRTVVGKRVRSR
ncbi:SixA phosphatase family protein, partial [Streptomyces brasiliscabiei]|uniref:SixA phosphatase family protein n=1 Tax=Streptomyces brasiliscabiei TaxID=2736302 RepID=UPI0038F6C509